jgi:hypothetical protein
MNRRLLRTLTLAGLALFASFVRQPAADGPQDPKQPAAKMSPAEKEKKVRELLAVTNQSNMGKEAMDQMLAAFREMPNLPEGFVEKFSELAKPEDLVELIVPIYVKHVDEADLQPTIDFFKTASGSRWILAQGVIMKESMAAGQEWGKKLAERTIEELNKGK